MTKPRLYTSDILDGLPEPGLDDLYARLVIGQRTRRVELPGRICRADILKTLLGYEVKLGAVRKNCPDAVTARYLAVFGSLGLDAVLIPYNPVETAAILPAMEGAFAALEPAARAHAQRHGRPERTARLRRRLFHQLARRIRTLTDRPVLPGGGGAS
jgi:hypothetical protein